MDGDAGSPSTPDIDDASAESCRGEKSGDGDVRLDAISDSMFDLNAPRSLPLSRGLYTDGVPELIRCAAPGLMNLGWRNTS